jgi:HEPN domain-containing protein
VVNRAGDWLAQADRDLDHARESATAGRHEWACFAAQQSAEKAVTAGHLHLGQGPRGPLIAPLLRELPLTLPEDLVARGQVLDNFYTPTRYPNGHPEGAPFEHYGRIQSGEGIRHAGAILEFIRTAIA